jgi:hypothetical protein
MRAVLVVIAGVALTQGSSLGSRRPAILAARPILLLRRAPIRERP